MIECLLEHIAMTAAPSPALPATPTTNNGEQQ